RLNLGVQTAFCRQKYTPRGRSPPSDTSERAQEASFVVVRQPGRRVRLQPREDHHALTPDRLGVGKIVRVQADTPVARMGQQAGQVRVPTVRVKGVPVDE